MPSASTASAIAVMARSRQRRRTAWTMAKGGMTLRRVTPPGRCQPGRRRRLERHIYGCAIVLTKAEAIARYPMALGWTSGPRGAGAPIHVHVSAIPTFTGVTDVVFVRNVA